MRAKHIVVIGTSAGGIETLRELVAKLPRDFAAPVCVVMHTSPQSPGVLGDILDRAGVLPATNARDRERLVRGRIYMAPPDCHLLIEPGIVRVTKGPRENRFRPADARGAEVLLSGAREAHRQSDALRQIASEREPLGAAKL